MQRFATETNDEGEAVAWFDANDRFLKNVSTYAIENDLTFGDALTGYMEEAEITRA